MSRLSWSTIGICAAASAAFSCKGVLAKMAYAAGGTPMGVVTLRMVLCLPIFLTIALYQGRGSTPITRRDRWAILGLGILGYYLASVLDFLGLALIGAGLERMILFSYPILTVIFSAIYLKRWPPRSLALAALLTYVGLAVAVHDEYHGPDQESLLLGSIYVAGSALCYAAFLTLSKGPIQRYGGIRILSWSMVLSAVALLIQESCRGTLITALSPDRAVGGWAVAIAVIGTLIPTMLAGIGLRRAGPELFAIIGSVGPITTVILAWLFLHETLTLQAAAGGVAVIVGSLWASRCKPTAVP